MVKSGYLENTFPTLVPLVTAFQASHHPDRNVSLFSSIPLTAWAHSKSVQLPLQDLPIIKLRAKQNKH